MRVVEAEQRRAFGKGANRKLRAQGLIPAIVYGERKEPVSLAIDPNILIDILRSDSGVNTIFELQLKGSQSNENVMVKDYQLEPVEHKLLHADLIRVAMDHALTVNVPIELSGTPVGVKQQGGLLDFVTRAVVLSCLPADIPDKIEVDVSELAIGGLIRVSELKLSDKVKLLTDPEIVIAHVVAPKAEVEPEPAAVPAEAAEPEVIKRGKAGTVEEEPAKGSKVEEKPERPKRGAEEARGKEKQ